MLGIRNWARNIWDTLDSVRPSAIIPPSIWGTIEWVLVKVPQSLGFGSPAQQLTGSVVVAMAMVIASLGVLTIAAVFMVIPFSIGVARHNDRVDAYWRMVIPRWEPATNPAIEDFL